MDTFKLNVSLPAIDTFYVNVVERICKKGSVFMNGVEYSETGIYVDTMQSIAGCDSIVTLDLMIVDKYEDFDTVSICEGESYIFNGLELTETGDYYAIFTTIIGCDGIVSLRLDVNPTMTIEW